MERITFNSVLENERSPLINCGEELRWGLGKWRDVTRERTPPRASVTDRVREPPSLSVFPDDAGHVPHSGVIGIVQTQTGICG